MCVKKKPLRFQKGIGKMISMAEKKKEIAMSIKDVCGFVA